MKVALVVDPDSAPLRALTPLLPVWREDFPDVEVEVLHPAALPSEEFFEGYDVVHFGWLALYERWLSSGGVLAPTTANLWNLGRRQRFTSVWLEALQEFARIFVDDVMTLQLLGQGNYTRVTLAPITLSRNGFTALPAPPRFTVGTLCTLYGDKRPEVIVEGARLAGAECLAFVFPPDQARSFDCLRPVEDVYQRVSVYAHASFTDTNSLPAMEALACGRPVVATRSDGLQRTLRDGRNGLWFDGSPEDLAEKLSALRAEYPRFAAGARETEFPSARDSARRYVEVWRKLA